MLRPKTAPPAAEKARELFFWDRAKTQWIRELILNDKIRHIVNEATSVRLVESEGDPTRVEHVRAMQLIFEHATDGLIRDMGKAAFSAFLHELTDGLQHEEFERYVASLIMNRHIDHEALREKENRHVVEQELRSLDDL